MQALVPVQPSASKRRILSRGQNYLGFGVGRAQIAGYINDIIVSAASVEEPNFELLALRHPGPAVRDPEQPAPVGAHPGDAHSLDRVGFRENSRHRPSLQSRV